MQYMMLIYSNEKAWETMTEAERTAGMGAYLEFNKQARAAGQFVAGDALQPTSTATTVRVRDGKVQLTDGPYVETREQLGGYYLINAKDLDEATAIAARIPGAHHGAVEIRPVVVFG